MAPVCPCISFQGSRRTGILAIHSWAELRHGVHQPRDFSRSISNSNPLKRRRVSNSRYCTTKATVDDRSTLMRDTPETEDDYYSILGLEPDATAEDIKKAYYACMKECHPDLIGDDSGVTNFCMFVNEVYEVLSDPEQRMVYDVINGYALAAKNPFQSTTCTRDRVFVDEFSCIGCKNCVNTSPRTFRIEEDNGRARVISQSCDPQLTQIAVETCPVDCIHWVSAQQLALLEDEMRRVELVNVGLMLSGMGYQSDVFQQANTRWERRQAKARALAKARAMNAKPERNRSAWWQVVWEQTTSTATNSTEERGKVNKAAAAARRWREYSRRGFYGKPTQFLTDNNCEAD